jgi:hypothetical protein
VERRDAFPVDGIVECAPRSIGKLAGRTAVFDRETI